MDQIRILGFAGSLRRASYNRGLVRAASELILVDVPMQFEAVGIWQGRV